MRSIDWNAAKLHRRASVAVPLLFGLISLWLGQDSNWDLGNYHRYNAFALLDGKVGIDLAPAGMQSYFNPLLDVPYYLMTKYWPAPLVGFVMGVVHGLTFVLVLGIAKAVCSELRDEDRYRVPLFLAAAGVLTVNFLSGLGNSMGDDTTALFVLASMLTVVRQWGELGVWPSRAVRAMVVAGMLVGAGAGLKLTNATYAVALCASLYVVSGSLWTRIRIAFVFGVGVLLGMAVTGGYWFWTMWHTFGNPLFPQFGSTFPNPLASAGGVADTSWLPKNVRETLLWPFIISLNSLRAGQVRLHQIVWPVAYVLFVWWAIKALISVSRREAPARSAPSPSPGAYVLACVAIGFVVWMKLFSIFRYIVAIEVLTPLAIWLLLNRVLSEAAARRWASYVIVAASAVALFGGVQTWGHEPWASQAFSVDVPRFDDPLHTTVLVVDQQPTYGWVVPAFPPSIAFVSVKGSFPEGSGYAARVRQIIDSRGGPTYALVPFALDWRARSLERINHRLTAVGVLQNAGVCSFATRMVDSLHMHAMVVPAAATPDGRRCELTERTSDRQSILAQDNALMEHTVEILSNYRVQLDPSSCSIRNAFVGGSLSPYRFCRVTPAWHA
ncbi:glycosyltransferase 87 family protein [Trinickia violacea]|nr:glycosyltransferase 87 family protein [Trinickia violacea]